MNIQALIDEAVSPPVVQRALVADPLLQTLNRPESATDKAWGEVARRRPAEIREGKAELIPGERVFQRIRERFEK